MECVSCQLQDMYKESISQSNANKISISSLDTRLAKLEEHTHRIVGLLEKLHVLMPPAETGNDDHAQSGRTVSLSDVEFKGKRSRVAIQEGRFLPLERTIPVNCIKYRILFDILQ